MNTVRSIGLSLQRRINEIYGAVAPIKAATDTWTLNNTPELLPTEIEVKAAVLAFEALKINPLRLNEEIDEIKAGAPTPSIAGQVIIGWDNISPKPEIFPSDISMLGNYDQLPFAGIKHQHDDFTDLYGVAEGIRNDVMGYNFNAAVMIFPTSVSAANPLWTDCDGSAIPRNTQGGDVLYYYGCQFGVGDGSTTVNVPNMTAINPPGYVYRIFVGTVLS